jgi:hypothetical protein
MQDKEGLFVSTLRVGLGEKIELLFTVCGLKKKFNQTKFIFFYGYGQDPNRPRMKEGLRSEQVGEHENKLKHATLLEVAKD